MEMLLAGGSRFSGGLAAYIIESIDESTELGKIDSKIMVMVRYDPENMESRRKAVDACTGILNENGYILSHMEKKICGGCFVSVEGTRLKDSSKVGQ